MADKIFVRGYGNIAEKNNQECEEADTRLKGTAFQMTFG